MDWDATLYDSKHSFVAAFGAGVLELLDAQPGERVLDVGCGTGDHVAELRENGVIAAGIDASAEMIQRATDKFPGLPVTVGDVRALGIANTFDSVFSNATLHWVLDAREAATEIARVLRPGGRFVAEFGGSGNIATIEAAALAVRKELGLPPTPRIWYFPTIGEYSTVLEQAGFEVNAAWLFDRPTRLDGADGMANWLRGFGSHLLDGLDLHGLDEASVAERVRPSLWHDGAWWADYRRLRITATKRPHG